MAVRGPILQGLGGRTGIQGTGQPNPAQGVFDKFVRHTEGELNHLSGIEKAGVGDKAHLFPAKGTGIIRRDRLPDGLTRIGIDAAWEVTGHDQDPLPLKRSQKIKGFLGPVRQGP